MAVCNDHLVSIKKASLDDPGVFTLCQENIPVFQIVFIILTYFSTSCNVFCIVLNKLEINLIHWKLLQIFFLKRLACIFIRKFEISPFFDWLKYFWIKWNNSSVLRQKGEFQNGYFKKTKHAKFFEKRTFLTPWYAQVCERTRG